MKRSKDEPMKSEAQQWACELESLGREVLAHCEGCSQDLLHWSPPYLGYSSVCTLATQLGQEIEHWVLVQIGERRLTWPKGSEDPSESTYADLRACYQEWIQQIHLLLDPLPDAFLDLYVGSRFGISASKRTSKVYTVRMCLFHAIQECAILLGRIEVICQLASDHMPLDQEAKTEIGEEQTRQKVVAHAV
jgi:hypothetical protein